MTWLVDMLAALRALELRAWLVCAIVAVALLGLLRRSAGPGLARWCTVPVLAVLAVAAWGLVALVDVLRPERVRVVATGAPPQVLPPGCDVRGSTGDPGALALALAAADVDRVSLVWTAPIPGAGVPAAGRAPVANAVAPLGFAPADLTLRVAPMRAGRPAELLLSLPVAAHGHVELHADHQLLAELPFVSEPGVVALSFTPEEAGDLRVVLVVRAGAHEVQATGTLPVAPARTVGVVGQAAANVAAALRAQQLEVAALAELPADLGKLDALVLLDPLPPAAQVQVANFIDLGGGVLFVGGERGGGLPLRDEDSAKCSPLWLAQRPAASAAPQPAAGTEPPPPDHEPPPPESKPPVLPPADRPVQGDTSSAKPPVGEEVDVERRDVAMVFVIDRSTSMTEQAFDGGPTRMEFVRSAAQATASRLAPSDQLAIVTFGNPGKDELVLPLTPAEPLEPVHRAFAQLAARANEGTYVDSALIRAAGLLAKSNAAVRHLVVITDGQIEDLVQACSRAQAAKRAGVTSSLIRFGPLDTSRYTALCRRFVELGGGQFLHASDTQEVPALVTAEVKRVLGSTGRRVSDEVNPLQPRDSRVAQTPPPDKPSNPQPTDRQPTAPQPPAAEPVPPAVPVSLAVRALAKSPLLSPIPDLSPPNLYGILPVTARPEARVLLAAGPEGRPLLAFKNYGLGRTAAWSADLTGPWSSDWQRAPTYPAWLAQWLGAVLPAERAVQPVDALVARATTPDGPTPAMLADLRAWSGGELSAWPPPEAAPARVRVPSEQPLAIAVSLWAAVALLLLLGVEFTLARRSG